MTAVSAEWLAAEIRADYRIRPIPRGDYSEDAPVEGSSPEEGSEAESAKRSS